MVKYVDGRNCIEYHDFVDLLNDGGWKLRIKMKDNWDAQDHLTYLSGLYHSRADLTVVYSIDSSRLENARRIDVYIISSNQDVDSLSVPKHIQFINNCLTF